MLQEAKAGLTASRASMWLDVLIEEEEELYCTHKLNI